MTTSTSSLTVRDYPDARLCVVLDVDEPVALAIEVKDGWMVRDLRGGVWDVYGCTEVEAREALDGIAGVER